jgi:hypothetical protein
MARRPRLRAGWWWRLRATLAFRLSGRRLTGWEPPIRTRAVP